MKNNVRNNQSGFALGGSILAWALGLASIFGGASYFTNQGIESDTPVVQRANTRNFMNNQNQMGNHDHTFVPDYQNQLHLSESGDLSDEERDGLITMREEEKLARDVYRTLYEKWGDQVFQNISYSENRHTLAMKALLDSYGIEDPVTDDTTGEFTIPEMQELYDALVEQGSGSLVDALKVGATIEDLDIHDLHTWIASTDNQDILSAYDNLIRGSRNHMRSYVGRLESLGESYQAQYISQEELEDILEGDHEMGSAAGTQQGTGYGQGMGQGLRDGSGQGMGRGQGRGMRFTTSY